MLEMFLRRFSRSDRRYNIAIHVHAETLEQDRSVAQTEPYVRGQHQLSLSNGIGQDSVFAIWIFNGHLEMGRV